MRSPWRWLAASIVLFAALAGIDVALRQGGTEGIVAFELAGTTDRAREIVGAWGADGVRTARASLLVDYAYIVAYTAFFVLACRALGAPSWLTALAFAPGVLDAIEDVALLVVLGGHTAQPWPAVARGFAVAKFTTGAVVWAYLLGATAARLVRRRRAAARA